MTRKRALSIIIPVYNEGEFLKSSITNLIKRIKKEKTFSSLKYEILLVENGSRDDSLQKCKNLERNCGVVKTYHLGFSSYGEAIKMGILKAKYPLVVIFNVDYWDIDFLKRALELIDKCDIVVGSKTLIPSRDKRPLLRKETTYFFNLLLRIIFNFPGTDTHGLKVLRKDKIIPLAKRCYAQRELFDTEMILRACKQKLVLTELAVEVKEVRPSRYNNLRRIYNTSRDLFTIFNYKYLNGVFYRR